MLTRHRKLKRLLLMCTLCLTILLSGCWDNREIEQLAVMNSMGFDLLPTGEWQVSVLLLNPFIKGIEPSHIGESPNILLKGTGETIGAAINDFSKRMSRIDFWGSLENVIIGEAAAQHISDIIRIHLRHPETRLRTNILVTPGEAFDVLKAYPDTTINLSREIKLLSELSIDKFGYSYGMDIAEFAENLLCVDRDPVAPLIYILDAEEAESGKTTGRTIFLEGLAVFKEDEMIAKLNRDQALAYLIIVHDIRRAHIAVNLEDNGKKYFFLLARSKSKIKPIVNGDEISYRLSVKLYGSMIDDNGQPLTLDNIEHIEKQVSEKILSHLLDTIKTAQDLQADFLGFTKELHRREPKTWKKIHANWRESFANTPVEVEVETTLRSTGLITTFFGVK